MSIKRREKSPSEVYAECSEANAATIAQLRAIGSLVAQRERLMTSISDASLMAVSGAATVALDDGASYALISPSDTPLGVLGFFGVYGQPTLPSSSSPAEVSEGCSKELQPSLAHRCYHNPTAQLLVARIGRDIDVLLDAIRDGAAAIEGAVSSGGFSCDALDYSTNDESCIISFFSSQRLATLLLQHAALVSAVVTTVLQDVKNEDIYGGARYLLMDILAEMRRVVFGWFGAGCEVPDHLAMYGATVPPTVLASVPPFLEATNGFTSNVASNVQTIPPMQLSDVVGITADGLGIIWALLLASCPELTWELDL